MRERLGWPQKHSELRAQGSSASCSRPGDNCPDGPLLLRVSVSVSVQGLLRCSSCADDSILWQTFLVCQLTVICLTCSGYRVFLPIRDGVLWCTRTLQYLAYFRIYVVHRKHLKIWLFLLMRMSTFSRVLAINIFRSIDTFNSQENTTISFLQRF